MSRPTTLSESPERAVSIRIGTSLAARMRSATSKPSRPGSITSSTTRSGRARSAVGPEALAFGPFGHPRGRLELLAAGLHGDLWMGEHVVVPGRIGRGTALAGGDDVPIAIARESHDRAPRFSRLGPGGGQDHER